MAARARPASGRRLFAVFAVALLVPVLILGAVLNAAYRSDVTDRALADGRTQAQILAETAIVPLVDGEPLDGGLGSAGMTRVGAAVQTSVQEQRVVALRLISPRGQVVYPPDSDPASTPRGAAVTAAEAGRATAAVRMLSGDDAVMAGYQGQVIEVYAPLMAPGERRVLGVVEVQLPYAEVARAVDRQVRSFDLILAAGLLSLYLVVAAISWVVTRRLQREAARSEHLALHDSLTGLANRELFRIRATRAVGGRRDVPCSVAILDLDRFKEVNDGLGHPCGDLLLTEVARRLGAGLRSDDTVARLGGDEFGILLPGTAPRDAGLVLQAAVDAVCRPVEVAGVEVTVGASVGVAGFPADAVDVADLMRYADIAMYTAKTRGRAVTLFDAAMEPAGRQRLALVSDLARAVAEDQLFLHYQPIVRLADRAVIGVEALMRWRHPVRGVVPPDDFIPAAEETGLIDPLTCWLLETAPADLLSLADIAPDLTLSVNVSARTLHDPAFAARLAGDLADSGLRPERLVLEMTETALVRDAAAVHGTLRRIRELGVGVSMDDFGQGTTSLIQLSELPLTEMKLDRAVVALGTRAGADADLVRAVVAVARGLDLHVVAEGVEEAGDLDRLQRAGCTSVQGWAIARAMSLADLRVWLTGPGAGAGAAGADAGAARAGAGAAGVEGGFRRDGTVPAPA